MIVLSRVGHLEVHMKYLSLLPSRLQMKLILAHKMQVFTRITTGFIQAYCLFCLWDFWGAGHFPYRKGRKGLLATSLRGSTISYYLICVSFYNMTSSNVQECPSLSIVKHINVWKFLTKCHAEQGANTCMMPTTYGPASALESFQDLIYVTYLDTEKPSGIQT